MAVAGRLGASANLAHLRRGSLKATKKLEFANFTCTFGDKLVMLDLFEEVVSPSFQQRTYVRKLMGGEYFFLNTLLLSIESPQKEQLLCLAGRLVKNTKIRREQVFRGESGLVEDYSELESAPSSIFVLILNNHRLLYVKEVSGAPDLSTFRSTCQNFLNASHRAFIQKLYKQNKLERAEDTAIERKTKKELLMEYPYPVLRVTPLTDKQELREFIQQFATIQGLSVKLLKTNREDIDNDEFWAEVDRRRDKMGSSRTSVDFSNRRDGLNESEVYEQCNAATALGNSEIKIQGLNSYGDKLKGNNTDFSLSVELEDLSKSVPIATPKLVGTYLELVQTGTIKKPTIIGSISSKIASLIGKLI